METKQTADNMESFKLKMSFTNSEYCDPKGRSGGLGLWWRDDCKLKINYKYAHLIDMWLEVEGKVGT